VVTKYGARYIKPTLRSRAGGFLKRVKGRGRFRRGRGIIFAVIAVVLIGIGFAAY
jgi:hypothetical protein